MIIKKIKRVNQLRIEFDLKELATNCAEYNRFLAVKAYEPQKEINRENKIFLYFDESFLLDMETIQETEMNKKILF